MDELYQLIETKIKSSGYQGEISGYDIYNEICDWIEDKDNGTYIFLSKKTDSIIYEYKIDILPDNFNLSTLTITDGTEKFIIDFDAQ
jgi:hypothetical protein